VGQTLYDDERRWNQREMESTEDLKEWCQGARKKFWSVTKESMSQNWSNGG